MFGEGSAAGFIPAPIIDLRAGNLYNVAISLLVFLSCIYAAWVISAKGRRTVAEKTFSLFLAALGFYWLMVAIGNLLAWFNLLAQVDAIAYPIKFISIFPLIILVYYFCSEIFKSETITRGVIFLYILVGIAYLIATFRLDLTQSMVSYWGVQWQVSTLPLLIYWYGLLFPLGLAIIYLTIKMISAGLIKKKAVNLTLNLGAFIFVLLENLQISAAVVTWQRLLARLFYILIAFGVYMYFVGRVEEQRFVPREEKIFYRRQVRIPFFVKLLFLFIFLAVIPIAISSLLMFTSFKEIIDLYIYRPLLWNLKTSREAFLMALTHVQIQALFLMILTGLLVFLASVIVSRAIAESLRSVSKGMGRVSGGDFSFKLRQESNDEIGDVIKYFNEMSGEIKRSREIMEKWNRELEIKVAERTEDLRTLYYVSKAVGSSLDLELLIDRAIEYLLPIMKAEVYAMLLPGEKAKFSARVRRGIDLKSIEIEEGKGLLGETLHRKEILYSENIADDPRCQENWYKDLGLKSMVVAPLRTKGKTEGILIIGNRGERRYFEEREINLLATVSDQLAIAIENVGIYEKEKEAVARLTELDRIKNEFISMISHELRTPVTAADGYVSLFLTGGVGPITEDQKKCLKIVKENDQRLLALINRLLDFSKIETGRFSIRRELVSMHEVIRFIADIMKLQLEKKTAKLRLRLEAKHDKFMGDQDRMGEVLINLIENALKFGREGTPLKIEVSTKDAGDFIQVAVSDNGIGIEAEHLEKIFNKFYQTEETLTRKVGGVGLGLSIVKEIIGNHRGRIWAESKGKEKGAEFIFTVPIAEKI